jgi:hypothetical protein
MADQQALGVRADTDRVVTLPQGGTTTIVTEDREGLLDAVDDLASRGQGPYHVAVEGQTVHIHRGP